jgi:hypothetical protein
MPLPREDLAHASETLQNKAAEPATPMIKLLEQNTQLTELTKVMTERFETLTMELHAHLLKVDEVSGH